MVKKPKPKLVTIKRKGMPGVLVMPAARMRVMGPIREQCSCPNVEKGEAKMEISMP